MDDDGDEGVNNFVRRINRRAANVRENVEHLRRAVATEMLSTVVRATPVDTGKARSNWKVGIGVPDTDVQDPYSPGMKLGLSESANASAAIAAGNAVIAMSSPDDVLYISNSVPYINRLNDGYSKQAPAGFVERALAAGQSRARRVRRLLEAPVRG